MINISTLYFINGVLMIPTAGNVLIEYMYFYIALVSAIYQI